MLVYNKTKYPITFEHSKRLTLRFEPFGPCEVSEEVFEHMKLQRFPVSLTPVPPPEKAAAIRDDAAQAARADELERLKDQNTKLATEIQTTTAAVEKSEKAREATDLELQATQRALAEANERAQRHEADLKAANKLLEETARQLEEAKGELARLTQTAAGAEAEGGKGKGKGGDPKQQELKQK